MSRAQRSLWILTGTTILATGILAQALAAPASTGADMLVAAGGLLLMVCTLLLVRVFRYLVRLPAHAHSTTTSPTQWPKRRPAS